MDEQAVRAVARLSLNDMTEGELYETVSSVEATWGRRYERELREVDEDESLDPIGTSRRIVDEVDELCLQPFEPPDPLSPIQRNEVKLVCWMVIAPALCDRHISSLRVARTREDGPHPQ